MDIKKKVVVIAVCAELVAMGALWFGRKNHGTKASVAAQAPVAAAVPSMPATEPPATTHRVSAFSSHPFTADVTIVTKSATFHHIQKHPSAAAPAGDSSVSYHGKMYAGRDASRTDMEMGKGVTASVIVRYDKGVSWILMPGNHYIESPIDEHTDLLDALRDPNAKVKKQDLGAEKVGSYPCEKYKVEVTSRGHTQSGWIWMAKAKNLDGFIVKTQDAASKESVTLSDIRLGPPPASVFNLPAGYHKLAETAKPATPVHR